MSEYSEIVKRLRISRCYVRGPGDVGYDSRGEHDKHDGKPVGNVEDERREAAQAIERLEASEKAADKLAIEAYARTAELEQQLAEISEILCGQPNATELPLKVRSLQAQASEAHARLNVRETELAEARAREENWIRAWEFARKTLPPDRDLNAPWSQCIAVMDEALPAPPEPSHE